MSELYENNEMSLREFILDIRDWANLLKSKRKKIFFIGIIGALIGLMVSFFNPPTYNAVLTFALEDDKGSNSGSGISSALGLANSFGIDLGGAGGGGAFAASNLTELMRSRLIVEKVLLNPVKHEGKNIFLLNYYIEKSGLKNKWNKIQKLKNITFQASQDRRTFSRTQDSLLSVVYNNLIESKNLTIMQKDKKITILSIVVNSGDELFSKLFCENIAKETSEFYILSKSKKARINVDVLQKQVDSVRNELSGAITGVATEVDNIYNLNPALNKKGAESKKKQVDVQANTAILTNLTIQLELAKINLRKETPLIQLIDKPILPLQKNKFPITLFILIGFILNIILSSGYFIILTKIKNAME
jgi:uncharacterized protein involved in exopolysaccharide biosynthesis